MMNKNLFILIMLIFNLKLINYDYFTQINDKNFI